jgi:hypothetical protein
MKTICVVVNKWWEVEAVLGVLVSAYANSQRLPWPLLTRHPRPRPSQAPLPPIDPNPLPRATFEFELPAAVRVEIWCISDLLEHIQDPSEFQSSTQYKAARLPLVVARGIPDLTLAVGTAACGVAASDNGNVVVGTRVFMYNGNPNNPASKWTSGPFETVVSSRIDPALFSAATAIEPEASSQVRKYFMVPPANPATCSAILANFDHVALSDMNVTKSEDYVKADPLTLDAFTRSGSNYPFGSLETTHALIRVTCGWA